MGTRGATSEPFQRQPDFSPPCTRRISWKWRSAGGARSGILWRAPPETGDVTVTRSTTPEITETIEKLEDIPSNNLPIQSGSFVGREREIA
jgi:hypothetical protein